MAWEPERWTATSLANGSLVLKLDTLLKLSESTSYDLRAAYVLTYGAHYAAQADIYEEPYELFPNGPRKARPVTCF